MPLTLTIWSPSRLVNPGRGLFFTRPLPSTYMWCEITLPGLDILSEELRVANSSLRAKLVCAGRQPLTGTDRRLQSSPNI